MSCGPLEPGRAEQEHGERQVTARGRAVTCASCSTLSVPSVSSVVIVFERSGRAGRQCDFVRELAGDFVVYDHFFADQRIEPMSSSAVRLRFQSNAAGALLVMAHPGR